MRPWWSPPVQSLRELAIGNQLEDRDILGRRPHRLQAPRHSRHITYAPGIERVEVISCSADFRLEVDLSSNSAASPRLVERSEMRPARLHAPGE